MTIKQIVQSYWGNGLEEHEKQLITRWKLLKSLTTCRRARYPFPTLSKLIFVFLQRIWPVIFKLSQSFLFLTSERGSRSFEVVFTHSKNFPAKKLTPTMLKISQKMRHTSKTFIMEGIAPSRAFTTTCVHKNITTKCQFSILHPVCHPKFNCSLKSILIQFSILDVLLQMNEISASTIQPNARH